ncbi:hypothetical protein STEG23_037959 [Scotinomys teguina]
MDTVSRLMYIQFNSQYSYQLLYDQFDYKPILTKNQFLQSGFAEWKIQIVCDILNCVMKKHKELVDSDKRKAVVIRHLYSEDNIGIPEGPVSSTDVSEGCDESEEKTSEVMIHEEQASEIKAKLKDPCGHPEMPALLLALAECQDKLKRLDCVEKRLQGLEAATKGKVMVDEKAWNNLLSRVTLLETEMLLSKKNECSELHAASEDNDSVSVMDGLSIDNADNRYQQNSRNGQELQIFVKAERYQFDVKHLQCQLEGKVRITSTIRNVGGIIKMFMGSIFSDIIGAILCSIISIIVYT